MTDKKKIKQKKDLIEELKLLINHESLKKIISKGKNKCFLKRSECENVLVNESFDDKEESSFKS